MRHLGVDTPAGMPQGLSFGALSQIRAIPCWPLLGPFIFVDLLMIGKEYVLFGLSRFGGPGKATKDPIEKVVI